MLTVKRLLLIIPELLQRSCLIKVSEFYIKKIILKRFSAKRALNSPRGVI
jgi:hypothetical protein